MNERGWVVYKHTNKTNGKVYVGITSQPPQKRWRNGHGYSYNRYFWNAIKKHGWESGFDHEVIFTGLTENEAKEKEIELIEKYSAMFPSGYNNTAGGEGCNGRKMSEEEKRHLSVLKKGIKRPSHVGEIIGERYRGKKLSAEHRAKMSVAQTGRKQSEETKRLLSEQRKGIVPTAAVVAAAEMHKKKIAQYTLDGCLVNVWDSAMDAERSGSGYLHNAIAKNAKGKSKHHAGYIWKYIKEEQA